MANPLIKITNIKRDFPLGNEIVYVLKGIDLEINKGEYVALMGPSGSGKSKKATLDYFEALLPTISNDSVWIFDDIHWSTDMEEAWEIIKNHPKVSVTIDTFQWGIVFFRAEQEKEHFIINPNKTISSHLFERIRF